MLNKSMRKKKYLSHSYDYTIDGEELPDRKQHKKSKILLSVFISILVILLFNFVVVSSINIGQRFIETREQAHTLIDVFTGDFNDVFNARNVFSLDAPNIFYLAYLLIGCITGIWVYSKMNYGSEEAIAYGQQGDSRWTKLDELKDQYKAIPHTAKKYPGIDSFDGVGGVPISHYKNNYFIDTDTVNSAILGVSRSGKGETTITPMIDILSRAQIQSSMVLNDPKGELYASSKEILEARGYDVQVLNLQDPMQSMSYNPLQLVVEAWVQGNPEEAAKRANSIAFTLYNDPNAGDNAFFNEGAQSAVVAIILALVEHCVETNQTDRVTMGNVVDMLNELGTLNYTDGRDEKNALDEWFNQLPAGHVAKKRYGATSFAGDKTRGSILATANQGLQPFVDPLFAKMTSRNSVDLKQIGFPKYLSGQLSKDLVNQRMDISFHKNNKEKTLIKKYNVKIKSQGRYSLNFDEFDGGVVDEEKGIQDGDLVLMKHVHPKTGKVSKLIYELSFESVKDEEGNIVYRKKHNETHLPQLKREVKVKKRVDTFDGIQQHLYMKYSNNPTAVFMIVPDYDSSNHALSSIFTKQLYTELSSNAGDTKGLKCFKRVHYILDEFGNMPPIDDMDQVMTVCLGRNIVFNLVLQSFTQLNRRYGEGSDTIKENCQNLIYIMSKNEETIEEISKATGDKTVVSVSSNEHHGDANNSINKSHEQIRLITPTRLRQLLEGEQVIIRSLHRQDLKRKKVRPFPIFNTKETVMPYRFQFLSDWIDTSKELNEIDIPSEHARLELDDVAVDMSYFIRDHKEKTKYRETNNYEEVNKNEQKISNLDEAEKESISALSMVPKVSKKINTILENNPNDVRTKQLHKALVNFQNKEEKFNQDVLKIVKNHSDKEIKDLYLELINAVSPELFNNN